MIADAPVDRNAFIDQRRKFQANAPGDSSMSSRPGSPALPRPPRTIRRTLVHIVLACVLPAWLGIAVLIFGMYKVLGDRTPEGALMTAHALALAVDRELAIAQTALEALAGSEALSSGDLEGFREHALRDATTLGFNSVVLSRGDGQQVVNTLLPLGARLPVNTSAADDATVFRTGRPLIVNMFKGAVTGTPLVGIKVPVIRDGAVSHVLTATITPQRLSTLLEHQKLPPDWVGAVFDATQTIVARTHNPEQYVGQHASPVLGETMTKETPASSRRARSKDCRSTGRSAGRRPRVGAWRSAFRPLGDRSPVRVPVARRGRRFLRARRRLGSPATTRARSRPACSRWCAGAPRTTTRRKPARCGRGPRGRRGRPPARRRDDGAAAAHRRARPAERHKEIAEKATLLKDEFIATVSHELRTPLTAITASLALMEDDLDPHVGLETKELLDIAHANSRRLHRLVDDILDIEKLEAGKVAFHLGRVAVRPLLAQVIATDRALAERSGVALRLGPAQAVDVHADEDRLAQVVANLMSNAIKFSPRGREVCCRPTARGKVRITVRDHGPGIPAHFRRHVFEKFAQADNSDARPKGGTGLGLSIVKEVSSSRWAAASALPLRRAAGRCSSPTCPRSTRSAFPRCRSCCAPAPRARSGSWGNGSVMTATRSTGRDPPTTRSRGRARPPTASC